MPAALIKISERIQCPSRRMNSSKNFCGRRSRREERPTRALILRESRQRSSQDVGQAAPLLSRQRAAQGALHSGQCPLKEVRMEMMKKYLEEKITELSAARLALTPSYG